MPDTPQQSDDSLDDILKRILKESEANQGAGPARGQQAQPQAAPGAEEPQAPLDIDDAIAKALGGPPQVAPSSQQEPSQPAIDYSASDLQKELLSSFISPPAAPAPEASPTGEPPTPVAGAPAATEEPQAQPSLSRPAVRPAPPPAQPRAVAPAQPPRAAAAPSAPASRPAPSAPQPANVMSPPKATAKPSPTPAAPPTDPKAALLQSRREHSRRRRREVKERQPLRHGPEFSPLTPEEQTAAHEGRISVLVREPVDWPYLLRLQREITNLMGIDLRAVISNPKQGTELIVELYDPTPLAQMLSISTSVQSIWMKRSHRKGKVDQLVLVLGPKEQSAEAAARPVAP